MDEEFDFERFKEIRLDHYYDVETIEATSIVDNINFYCNGL
jgi:hypothetical protein